MLPETWKIFRLEEIAIVKDGTHKTPRYTTSGVPFLRVTDIKGSSIDLSTVKFISYEEHLGLIKRCKPEPGDILYSKNGTIGISCLINWDWEFSIFVSLALLKLTQKDIISTKYLVYVLDSELIKEQIRLRAKTGTVTNLHLEEIKEFKIPVPPLPEQKKIATVLNSVDEAIASTQAVIDQTRKVKQGLLQQLLTRGIGHTRFKESAIGKIPESWEVTTLGQIADKNGLQTGPFGSQLHASDYTENGIPVVMPKDIIDGRIVIDNITRIPEEIGVRLKKHRLKVGDIVFGRRGDIGRCGLISECEANWYCGTGCLRARLTERANPRYLIHYLRLSTTLQWLNDNAVGQTMLNLNTNILANLPVVLPPQNEQKKMASIFDSLEEELHKLDLEKSALSTLKRGLMQDLLTGKVRVGCTR